MAKWFHTRIREARERAEWSQSKLADELEVTTVTISNWENRKSEPRGDQRARVLDWLEKAEARASAKSAAPGRVRQEHNVAHRMLVELYEHWPQSRIAEALGVSQMTISNWLRTGNVTEKYADAIARVLRDVSGEPDQESPVSADGTSERSSYGDWLRNELERVAMSPIEFAQRAKLHINTILALLDGRTERPQARTQQRIASALEVQGKPRSQPASERNPWYYIGLSWTEEEIEQVPDEPGVYMIHDRLGRPAYIGVAYKGRGGIRARLRKHNEARWTADSRVARTFSYALAQRIPQGDAGELAKALEKLLIKFMGNAILINERNVEDISE